MSDSKKNKAPVVELDKPLFRIKVKTNIKAGLVRKQGCVG